MKRKTKQTLKTILLGALGIGAIVGVASGVNALVDKNGTELITIHPVFEIGGLRDSDGKFEKSETTIYTKNAFECQGLEIKLDFDNTIKYQVFYYESDGDFISASSVYEGNSLMEVPALATHARLELTPKWNEMGEDYEDEENQIVKWYETIKYASQIEVKVNKEQNVYEFMNMLGKDFLVVDNATEVSYTENIRYKVVDGTTFAYNPTDTAGYYACDGYLVKVKGGETVTFNNLTGLTGLQYSLWQFSTDNLDLNMSVLGTWLSESSKVDDNTDYLIISFKTPNAESLTESQIAKLSSCISIK